MTFHRHKWIVVSKEVKKSPWERLAEKGAKVKEFWGEEWFHHETVVHYRCKVCSTEKVVVL